MQKPRILLVEDDTFDAELLLEHLSGAVVTRVASVEAAETHLSSNLPLDLVVLDLQLGHRSGLELVEAVKAHATLTLEHVVVLSVSLDPRDLQLVSEAGINRYLPKPFSSRRYTEVGSQLVALATTHRSRRLGT